MLEKYAVDIIAITLDKQGNKQWRHGLIPPPARDLLLHTPQGRFEKEKLRRKNEKIIC